MIELRPYQIEAENAVFQYWEEGGGNPLIELGTGLGKSALNASICKRLVTGWPTIRIGCITHVKELIQQNAKELLGFWNAAPIGINSAGLHRRDIRSQILFGGIQSIWKKVADLGRFDVLIIDEAHLIPRNSATMYRTLIDALLKLNPEMRIILLTATPYRCDSGRLDEGEGKLADKLIYSYGIGEGVRDAYLCPLISKRGDNVNNIDGVDIGSNAQGRDFVSSQLEEAAMDNVRLAVEEMVDRGRSESRKGWLVFSPGFKHATAVRDEMRRRGVSCERIVGDKKYEAERDHGIKAFGRKEIQCLVSINCITTGFNARHVDLLGWMRDTLSPVIWVQGNGRGTRSTADLRGLNTVEERLAAIEASGKVDCRVLDFTGNSYRLGPVDDITPPRRAARTESDGSEDELLRVRVNTVRGKECGNESCGELVAIQARTCKHCGYEWPAPEADARHEGQADGHSAIMRSEIKPQWLPVSNIDFTHHFGKEGRPDTLRAEYTCGLLTCREWRQPKWWWWKLRGRYPTPKTIEEALDRLEELTWPREVLVERDGKYWKVLDHRMPPAQQDEEAA